MKRKIVYARVKIEIAFRDNINPYDVLNDMDYSFTSNTDGARVMDTSIEEFEGEPINETIPKKSKRSRI